MSLLLVPYNQAMRLGQGYNTYLQQICIDRAVTFKESAVRSGIPSEPTDVSTAPANDDVSIVQQIQPGDGPDDKPQIVTYKTAFADRLSDVVENLNISAAAGIRTGTLQASGSAAYVNENKFKESDINFVVNVKVTNDKTELDQELLEFNKIDSVIEGNTFTEHYGDGFISGFVEGGELNAIVNIKLLDKQDMTEVKANLQVATALVAAEGSGGFKSSTASKTAETNITINWSGGGQIKEPKAEWSISNLLEVAAAFPSQVAKCPQRTWAIITKYKYLRDYVEKVAKPTFMEYELAASYTAILLDNFIEYKLIIKELGKVMENLDQYEPSKDPKAYQLDIASLVKGRFDMQREMAKIVMRVNDITIEPKKALELAEEPLPEGVLSLSDSHLYGARLPVLKAASAPPTAVTPIPSAQPIWVPTPRSKTDSIYFYTDEIRTYQNPSLVDTKTYQFSSPRAEPPQFATGITVMDMRNIYPFTLTAEINEITNTGYRASLESVGESIKYRAGVTWFEVGYRDPDFQTGRVRTSIPKPQFYPDGQIQTRIAFPRPFSEDVEIVVWLQHLDVNQTKAGYLKIYSNLANIGRGGFDLFYGSTGATNNVTSLGYSWIAYPRGKEGVDSGAESVKVTANQGIGDTQGADFSVAFKKTFRKPPRVWIAFSGIEVNNSQVANLRVWMAVADSSITTTGFKYRFGYWGETVVNTGNVYWIATVYD